MSISNFTAQIYDYIRSQFQSRVQVGKNVCDRFPIRNGLKQVDALSPMLFNFALEYAMSDYKVKWSR